MADHDEAVDKVAHKLGLPQCPGSRRNNRERPPQAGVTG
jgi:hypothetical protein